MLQLNIEEMKMICHAAAAANMHSCRSKTLQTNDPKPHPQLQNETHQSQQAYHVPIPCTLKRPSKFPSPAPAPRRECPTSLMWKDARLTAIAAGTTGCRRASISCNCYSTARSCHPAAADRPDCGFCSCSICPRPIPDMRVAPRRLVGLEPDVCAGVRRRPSRHGVVHMMVARWRRRSLAAGCPGGCSHLHPAAVLLLHPGHQPSLLHSCSPCTTVATAAGPPPPHAVAACQRCRLSCPSSARRPGQCRCRQFCRRQARCLRQTSILRSPCPAAATRRCAGSGARRAT